jgi:serine/threonine protein kinase
MDKYKAIELEKELKGKILNDYKIIEFINNGKSAAVFKAEKGSVFFALKIFDNEIIEIFGHEIQTKRIEQEIALKNHTINNLVKIYDGGNTTVGTQIYYFIVMEFINGLNLKDYLQSKTCTQDFILNILNKLSITTEQLLNQKQIAHRDIKPENIMVKEDGDIILMDLGVLKLVGVKSFTDEEETSFIGTLRYAPPEFLLRKEEDSIEGWRAVNIYQIGATLHDLIMGKELFSDKTPYTNLVIAIKDDMPKISNDSLSFELQQLTRDMLTKDWKKRLELIPQNRITKAISIGNNESNSFSDSIEEIKKKLLKNQAKFDEIDKLERDKIELRNIQKDVAKKLSNEIDICFDKIKKENICSSIKKSESFRFDPDTKPTNSIIQNYLYELQGDLKMGFPRNLYIIVRISNEDSNYSEIKLWGIFPKFLRPLNIENPISLFQELAITDQKYNYDSNINFVTIFKGIVDFDKYLSEHLILQIIRFISRALNLAEKQVLEEIQNLEKRVKSNESLFITIGTSGNQNIVIDSM